MRPIREVIPGISLILLLAALAACGTSTAPSHPSSPPTLAGSSRAAAPGSPSPTPAAPATPAGTPGQVLSFRVSYPWHWPNDAGHPANVQHHSPVPPLSRVIAIGAGDHPGAPGERPYNRMSFTFSSAFPSYQIRFVPALVSDPSGRRIPLAGTGILQVTFRQAQAHTSTGRSSVLTQPPADLGFSRFADWAPAGDFEGVVTYGMGITWPVPHSNPQIAVRAAEVERVTAHGQHRYTVAIDIDATPATTPH